MIQNRLKQTHFWYNECVRSNFLYNTIAIGDDRVKHRNGFKMCRITSGTSNKKKKKMKKTQSKGSQKIS